jgi:hypothetical protein
MQRESFAQAFVKSVEGGMVPALDRSCGGNSAAALGAAPLRTRFTEP